MNLARTEHASHTFLQEIPRCSQLYTSGGFGGLFSRTVSPTQSSARAKYAAANLLQVDSIVCAAAPRAPAAATPGYNGVTALVAGDVGLAAEHRVLFLRSLPASGARS